VARAERPTVLILGGTTEARELAARLLADPVPPRVVTSLAGRTSAPEPVAGEVRRGGFGCAADMARWLATERASVVVDATHPFARVVSAEALAAARRAAVPLVRLVRPGWSPQPGDDWRWVDGVDEAAALVPSVGRRALLAVGRQELAPFASVDGVRFLIRSIEPPASPLPPDREVLLARGPFDLRAERELLREHRIDVVVTKDSGGTATRAKLDAARELAIPVVIVRRPPTAGGAGAVPTVDAALAAVAAAT